MKDFPIICVGGSAGGLDACIRLLQHLPRGAVITIACSDFVLRPEEIAQKIVSLTRHVTHSHRRPT